MWQDLLRRGMGVRTWGGRVCVGMAIEGCIRFHSNLRTVIIASVATKFTALEYHEKLCSSQSFIKGLRINCSYAIDFLWRRRTHGRQLVQDWTWIAVSLSLDWNIGAGA